MKRALVLMMLMLMFGTACARAGAASELPAHDGIECVGGSLGAVWSACADAFMSSVERVRDESVLREGWDALWTRVDDVSDSVHEGLRELRARLDVRAQEWGDALGNWLAERGPQFEAAAGWAGESLGEALNAADAALDSAGKALKAALEGAQSGS